MSGRGSTRRPQGMNVDKSRAPALGGATDSSEQFSHEIHAHKGLFAKTASSNGKKRPSERKASQTAPAIGSSETSAILTPPPSPTSGKAPERKKPRGKETASSSARALGSSSSSGASTSSSSSALSPKPGKKMDRSLAQDRDESDDDDDDEHKHEKHHGHHHGHHKHGYHHQHHGEHHKHHGQHHDGHHEEEEENAEMEADETMGASAAVEANSPPALDRSECPGLARHGTQQDLQAARDAGLGHRMAPMLLKMVGELKGLDVRKIFLNDPSHFPNYKKEVEGRARYLSHLESLIKAEQCKTVADVVTYLENMVANAATYNGADSDIAELGRQLLVYFNTNWLAGLQQIENEFKADQRKDGCSYCDGNQKALRQPGGAFNCSCCGSKITALTGEIGLVNGPDGLAHVLVCPACLEKVKLNGHGTVTINHTSHNARHFRVLPAQVLCGAREVQVVGCDTPDCPSWDHPPCFQGPTRLVDYETTPYYCRRCLKDNNPHVQPAAQRYPVAEAEGAKTRRAQRIQRLIEANVPDLARTGVKVTVVEASRRNNLKVTLGAEVEKLLGGHPHLQQWLENNTYRATSYLLFARTGGVDMFVAGLWLHEFVDGPQAGLVHLQYMDSVSILQPGLLRTTLILTFLASATEVARAMGGRRLYIFAKTPQGRELVGSWVVGDQPADMQLGTVKDRQKSLLHWYLGSLVARMQPPKSSSPAGKPQGVANPGEGEQEQVNNPSVEEEPNTLPDDRVPLKLDNLLVEGEPVQVEDLIKPEMTAESIFNLPLCDGDPMLGFTIAALTKAGEEKQKKEKKEKKAGGALDLDRAARRIKRWYKENHRRKGQQAFVMELKPVEVNQAMQHEVQVMMDEVATDLPANIFDSAAELKDACLMNKYSFSTVTFAAQASVMFAFHLHHPDAPRCPVYCMDCHRPIVTTEYTGCGDCGRQGPAFCLDCLDPQNNVYQLRHDEGVQRLMLFPGHGDANAADAHTHWTRMQIQEGGEQPAAV